MALARRSVMTVFTYYVLGRGRNTLYILNILIVTTTLIIQTQFTNEEIKAQERSPKYTEDKLIQTDSQSCCSVLWRHSLQKASLLTKLCITVSIALPFAPLRSSAVNDPEQTPSWTLSKDLSSSPHFQNPRSFF